MRRLRFSGFIGFEEGETAERSDCWVCRGRGKQEGEVGDCIFCSGGGYESGGAGKLPLFESIC